jgi:hypothetical protein
VSTKFLAGLILVLALPCTALAQVASSSDSKLEYCYGPYALCTVARCSAPADKSPIGSDVECTCTVQAGYSVGKKCKANSDPLRVISRYAPIFSFQECPGVIDGRTAVWANCVNSPCKIDPNNPGVAKCKCQTASSTLPFVIASDRADKAVCSACTMDSNGHYDCAGGAISSATTAGAQQTTMIIQDAIGDVKIFPPPK